MGLDKIGEDGIISTATTMIQSETQKTKRQQALSLQTQNLQSVIVRHGNSPLARAVTARLRRKYVIKYVIARRKSFGSAQESSISSRFYMPHLRVQKDMKQIKQMLRALVEANEADRWLSAPNPMLGGVRPVDKIRQGKTRQVTEILALVQEGIHV